MGPLQKAGEGQCVCGDQMGCCSHSSRCCRATPRRNGPSGCEAVDLCALDTAAFACWPADGKDLRATDTIHPSKTVSLRFPPRPCSLLSRKAERLRLTSVSDGV